MVNAQRLVNIFIDLVKIDSESGNETNIRDQLCAQLKNLSISSKIDAKGNLIGHFQNPNSNLTILLSAHMDTVKPGNGVTPVIDRDIIKSKGATILGADDKSGIAIILEVLNLIIEEQIECPSILIVFTVEEEIGVLGAKALKDLNADYGFVLDVGGDIGTVITRAPSHERFTAKVIGKSSHAGIEPEKGINAIVAASKAISKLNIGKIDHESVANIGIISGGNATNIVPNEVTVEGEARSHNEVKLKKIINEMKNTFTREIHKCGAKVEFESIREYDLFSINIDSQILNFCKIATKEQGIDLKIKATGGGSDANYFNSLNIPTIVISTGMNKVHTVDEEIKISDMIKATEFLSSIIKQIQ